MSNRPMSNRNMSYNFLEMDMVPDGPEGNNFVEVLSNGTFRDTSYVFTQEAGKLKPEELEEIIIKNIFDYSEIFYNHRKIKVTSFVKEFLLTPTLKIKKKWEVQIRNRDFEPKGLGVALKSFINRSSENKFLKKYFQKKNY